MSIEDLRIMRISGTAIPLPEDNVDTDRITPADAMKELTYGNMPKYLFRDAKNDPEHPFNNPDYNGAFLLFVGKNFGTGSSRETAPQAIMRYGIRALVGESFAEIFAGNCNVLGIPAVTASTKDMQILMQLTQKGPRTQYILDLSTRTLAYPGGSVNIEIPESRRLALVEGKWNPLAMLKANYAKTREVAANLPYMNNFNGL